MQHTFRNPLRTWGALALLSTLALLAPALPAFSESIADQSTADSTLAERLDAVVASQVPADGPGVAVIVVQDGKTLLRKGYGMADLERGVAVEPDMVFRIGSMTKQFTAVALLQLVRDGKVRLDDPLAKYVPDFPGADTVTVEHLLTHTSGIKSYTGVPSFMARLREDMTPAQLVDTVRQEPADFAPGAKFLYNNTGYILLGIIVEKASGLAYGDYLQKHLFTPLGLAHTIVGDENRIVPRRALGYEQGPDGSLRHARYMSMTQPFAAGAIESNVDDLARWNAALLAGQAIDTGLLERAWTDHKTTDGKPAGYGFGWQVSAEDGVRFIEHGGGIMGFVSHGTLVPEKKLFVAVLHNALGTDVDPEWLANLLALEALGRPWNVTPVDLPPGELQCFTGVYDFDGVKRTITLEDGKLFAQREGSEKLALVPVAKNELAYARSFSRISFEIDAAKAIRSATFTARGQATARGTRVAEAPAPRREVTLDPALLDRYSGVYELAPGFQLTVTREGTQLFMQATGQGRAEAFAESETRFFLKVVDAQLVFTPAADPAGKAAVLTLIQGGREMPAKRVD
ncbi:MAG TPA: serine hydrolase [Thermoanaerobaculia bacterium]|nr:serine hydrolase [Thermoanaerobaculia bacterium]